MDILLDTHTIIWFLNGDNQLSLKAINEIEDPKNKKYISIVSLWEIAIKIGLQKLSFDGNTNEVVELIKQYDFNILQLNINHIIKYESLEIIHRDPFDRILVIQAQVDNMTIVTKDENIQKYSIKTLW